MNSNFLLSETIFTVINLIITLVGRLGMESGPWFLYTHLKMHISGAVEMDDSGTPESLSMCVPPQIHM